MSASLSRIISKFFGNKPSCTIAILYKLKLNQITVSYKNEKLNVWDVGGQDHIRPLWRYYYAGTLGFVLELHKIQGRKWIVYPTCATTGEGLCEGLEWLCQNAKYRRSVHLYLSNTIK
ncbi:hypothetical protein K493DRAFT_323230 [Basidiobolus meristosporus CBS 931.73]|uniref:ARF/SAR superfamily n=1 Tax=Basidiobolus meristosporus CBS 931.73 TaxID=1314790 RepID=A0A1Y1YZ32_9FUNG|nr:hypothetical protein K493DRAFT_323230 [Basidiobolus meristosporus CBS 931.73]|eukprot:ORY02825.1 hypothetical protein K493DRAFT_323230 [Basidiobolus meristosporus CBS 931.73]